MNRVVVTGLGFTSSIGNSRDEVLQSLRECRSGIEVMPELVAANDRVSLAGTVKGFTFPTPDPLDWTTPDSIKLSRTELRTMSPNSVYAVAAMEEAIRDAAQRRGHAQVEAAEPEGHDPAHHREGEVGQHQRGERPGAEGQEHQHHDDAERERHHGSKPSHRALLVLEFPTVVEEDAGRWRHLLLDGALDVLGEATQVAAPHVGLHDHQALGPLAVDLHRAGLEPDVGHLGQRHRRPVGEQLGQHGEQQRASRWQQ